MDDFLLLFRDDTMESASVKRLSKDMRSRRRRNKKAIKHMYKNYDVYCIYHSIMNSHCEEYEKEFKYKK